MTEEVFILAPKHGRGMPGVGDAWCRIFYCSEEAAMSAWCELLPEDRTIYGIFAVGVKVVAEIRTTTTRVPVE